MSKLCNNALPSSTDTMDVETNATCGLADHCTLFESIIDTLDAVVLHADEEA